ncbi:MAG: hypothetical protein ACUVTB_07535 [Candidatus Bathycorpusculaceae bacterium]
MITAILEKTTYAKAVQTWRTQNLMDYIHQDLDKRVKRDKATKLSVFFTGLSAYLPEPINLFLKGESGVGKSYNVVETLKYYPEEDIWFLGGLSPKALIHSYGILLNKYGEPIDLLEKPAKPKKSSFKDDFGEFKEAEYAEALENYKEQLKTWNEEIRDAYTLIDLSHKTLVFLESPEQETFRMLFPILSHDNHKVEYRFTDKTAKGQLRTIRVVIQGWPATIFLSTDKRYMEELATRSFTVTPEASKEKIEEANRLTNLKASFPWQYNHETEETETIKKLVQSIKNYFVNSQTDVVIPFISLHEFFPKEIVRDMRDFQHFTQFLKTITALHLYQRPFLKINDKTFLIATVEDVKKALEIYSQVFETTRTGTEQKILTFYHEVVQTKEMWYLKELTAEYNRLNEKKLSSETIRQIVERLSQIGYVDIQKDDNDKRLNVYIPLIKQEEKSTISQKLEKWTISASKLEKSFEEWLNKILHATPFYYYKDFSENVWGEQEINHEELSAIILQHENLGSLFTNGLCRISLTEDLEPKAENNPETIQFSENCRIVDNSQDKALPDFLWRQIPAAEKCELCGRFAVEYEVNDVKSRQILRRCLSCFEKMQCTFNGSIWKKVGEGVFER